MFHYHTRIYYRIIVRKMGLHAFINRLVVLMFDVCLCAHARAIGREYARSVAVGG